MEQLGHESVLALKVSPIPSSWWKVSMLHHQPAPELFLFLFLSLQILACSIEAIFKTGDKKFLKHSVSACIASPADSQARVLCLEIGCICSVCYLREYISAAQRKTSLSKQVQR